MALAEGALGKGLVYEGHLSTYEWDKYLINGAPVRPLVPSTTRGHSAKVTAMNQEGGFH